MLTKAWWMTTSTRGGASVLVLCALWTVGLSGAWASDKPCPVASDTFEHEPYLAKTVAALKSGAEIAVVAIGGASTEGRAAGSAEASWPSRFVQALKERYPQARITLTIRAVPRTTAAAMVARFGPEVATLKPSLVIWEAGTTDAVRGTDVEAFRETLHEGIDILRSEAADLVLMNMQYSPMTQSVLYVNRYLVTLRGVADVADIPLFPRHQIMYDWAEMGLLDSPTRTAEGRRELADWLYRCIGKAMADFVTREPPPPPDQ